MSRPSLRSEVLRGGLYLTLRQTLVTLMNVGGVLLLTRTIGPAQYGIFAGALGVFVTVQLLAQLGVHVFLIRSEQEPAEDVWHTASWLLFALGVAGVLIAGLFLPLIARWTRIDDIGAVAAAIFLTLPFSNLAQVPLARLERALDYKRVAWVDIAGQVLYFAVALTLAFKPGLGAWAPTAGYVVQQLATLGLVYLAAHYVPRLRWNAAAAREIVHFGAGFTTSLWLYQLRRLVNPLIVGRFLGAPAVGIVAVTTQVVGHLSFISTITWRLSTAALARVQGNHERLRRAITDGMQLQTMAVGPFLVIFTWLMPFVVPLLLGGDWSGIIQLYPFLAIASLANVVFNLESSTLYVLKRNGDMAIFHIVQSALLAVAAFLLVPRFGLVGYGFAELVAIASYAFLHVSLARIIGTPLYGRTLMLAAAMIFGLAYGYAGLWSVVGLIVLTIAVQPWREISGVVAELRGMAHE